MKLNAALKKLKASSVFKKFTKEHPDFYLVHAFKMLEEKESDWQIGYYSKKKDKMVVFDVGKKIILSPESEVFNKEGSVEGIDMAKVRVSSEKALETAERHIKKKYVGEQVTRRIVILQKIERLMWNLTFVTAAFNIINLKIDADSGKIFHDERTSILQLGKQ